MPNMPWHRQNYKGNNLLDANVIGGILRAFVPALITLAVAKGWVTPANTSALVDSIVIGVPAIAAAVWSIVTNLKSKA